MPNDAFVMMVLATSLGVATEAQAQNLPPLATHLNPSETALILVDYQYPFTNPAGDSYGVVRKDIEGGMLDRTVKLVKTARALQIRAVSSTYPSGGVRTRLSADSSRPSSPPAAIKSSGRRD